MVFNDEQQQQQPSFGVPLYNTPSPAMRNPHLPAWGPAAAVRSPSGTIVAPAGTIRSGGTKLPLTPFGAIGSGGLGTVWGIAGTVAMGALAYHGYKRNNSIGWALVWGVFGGLIWPLTVPIALAQGFGKRA